MLRTFYKFVTNPTATFNILSQQGHLSGLHCSWIESFSVVCSMIRKNKIVPDSCSIESRSIQPANEADDGQLLCRALSDVLHP
jgi:hypothetical protein